MGLDPRLARSRAQEGRAAAAHRGRQNSGSGNQAFKNDVRSADVLVECKRTDSAVGIKILVADLEDLRQNALLQGRTPVFQVEVGGRDYVVVGVDDYVRLRDERERLLIELAALKEDKAGRGREASRTLRHVGRS